MSQILKEEKYLDGSPKAREILFDDRLGQQMILKEAWYSSEVGPLDPRQATDSVQRRGGQQWFKENYVNGQLHGVQEAWDEDSRQQDNKYYLDGAEVSQQTYQSYVGGLASEIQAATDFGERGLSGIIAGYLLP